MIEKPMAVLVVVLAMACGGGDAPGGGSGGGFTGSGGGFASGGGAGGGAAASSCSNGVEAGQSLCPFGGNTLKVCALRNGGLFGKEVACGGATPSCAAEIVNGVPYAACCPANNVDDPRASGCTQ